MANNNVCFHEMEIYGGPRLGKHGRKEQQRSLLALQGDRAEVNSLQICVRPNSDLSLSTPPLGVDKGPGLFH